MDKLFESLTNLTGGVAYAIIFGILVACGLGFPLPEDLPLIATGYLVWDGTMSWLPAVTITLVGVLVGDSILFFIGRRLGLKFLEQGKLDSFVKPKKVRRTKAYFRKYGDKIVFFARFVAGFRAAAFFLAGALKMKYTRFLWLDGLAALLSVPIWIALGYGMGHWFGHEISLMLEKMGHLKTAFSLVVFTIVGVVGIRAYMKFKKAKKAQQARVVARKNKLAKAIPRA